MDNVWRLTLVGTFTINGTVPYSEVSNVDKISFITVIKKHRSKTPVIDKNLLVVVGGKWLVIAIP